MRLPLLCAALAAFTAAATPAHADGHAARVPPSPKYAQECGSCHVPYPPGLLGAASWQRVMGSLQRHYGSDASLDAADRSEIGAWLQAHAGSGRRVQDAPPEDRLTRSAWFVREHDEVEPATWRRVKSASACEACHTGAAQGSFREREIRLPR